MNNTLRVLMVEDSEDDAALLLHALRGGGYEVVHAVVNTATAMRNALGSQEWDVITSDHHMPGFSADEALALAMELRPNLPFIIVSGAIDVNLAVSLMKEGAKDYVPKRDLPRLLPAIERELREVKIRTEFKQADETRRRSEEFLQAVIEGTSDAIYVKDIDGRYVMLNSTTADFVGKSASEVIGRDDTFLFPRDQAKVVMDGDRAVVASGTRKTCEETLTMADGELRTYLSTKGPIFDAKGNTFGLFGVSRDITERHRAAEKLQTRDAYLTAIIENQPGLIWLKDVNGRFLAINHAFAASCGRETQDILGKTDLDIWSREMAEKYIADDGKVMDAGRPITVEELIDDKNEPKWFETFKAPIRDSHGNIIGTTGYARDITERKLSETRLRAAEEQFRSLVEQSITGIYIIQDGKFAYVNPRFAEIRGFDSADELIGRDPMPLIAEKDRSTVMESNRRLLSGETRNISYNFTALRKDGSTIEVGLHASGATYQGRTAIIGVMQDISEKARAEEKIRQYIQQLKSAFMSTVEVATRLSEMRDPYTAGHERRVAQLAAGIGTELGLNGDRVEGIRVAGYLHDVGKITIPAEILSKPSKLNAIELQLIQAHAQAGYEVMKDVAFPWPVAEIARQHHERMDGSGYPQGLKGERILLEARIMAVADVVEAMSSHRPYRPGLGIDKALGEIERGRGTAYDPVVVDACLKLFREKGYRIPV